MLAPQPSDYEEVGGINMDVTRHLRIFRPSESDEVAAGVALPTDPGDMDSFAAVPDSQAHVTEEEIDADSQIGTSAVAGMLRRLIPFTGALLTVIMLSGCTALRPLKGIPVRKLPWEFRGESRANMETIDLTRLGQTPLPAHLIDSGDVLAIYVEGVLGRVEDVPPVNLPQDASSNPTLGFPIPVREDGTISLPLIPPLSVRGLTVVQAEELVRRTYTSDGQILEKGRERILLSLQRARTYKITVLRQETSNAPLVSVASGGALQLGQSKQGTGQIVVLEAGENDVLHALTLTGGLPGLDAQNAIYVLRRPRLGAGAAPNGRLIGRASRPVRNRSDEPEVPSYNRPVSAQRTSRTPIQLTSGQGAAYTGRYGNAAPLETANGQPPWGHTVPQPDPSEAVVLEGSELPGHPATNVGFKQGYSEPMPLRQRLTSMPFPFPQPGVDDVHHAPISDGGTINYPPELQPYLSSGSHVIRIPIRLRPGEVAQFGEQDILLFDGDILFIESRQTEIFYTGGLLGGGQFQLPRDYDLDVLGAISIAQGRQGQGGGGAGFGNRIGGISAVNQDISVSASNLVIIRRSPDGGQINIKVDLNRVLRDTNENILIQPGDHLILRYKPLEAMGAFVERNLLAGSLFGLAASQATGGK